MTEIISIIGAPSSGKSVTSAQVYLELHKKDQSAHLVREYAQEHNARHGLIKPFEHVHILGKQVSRVSAFLGKVDYLIEDSPLLLNAFYSELVDGDSLTLECVQKIYEQIKSDGHKIRFFFLDPLEIKEEVGRIHFEPLHEQLKIFVERHFSVCYQRIPVETIERRAELILAPRKVYSPIKTEGSYGLPKG